MHHAVLSHAHTLTRSHAHTLLLTFVTILLGSASASAQQPVVDIAYPFSDTQLTVNSPLDIYANLNLPPGSIAYTYIATWGYNAPNPNLGIVTTTVLSYWQGTVNTQTDIDCPYMTVSKYSNEVAGGLYFAAISVYDEQGNFLGRGMVTLPNSSVTGS